MKERQTMDMDAIYSTANKQHTESTVVVREAKKVKSWEMLVKLSLSLSPTGIADDLPSQGA